MAAAQEEISIGAKVSSRMWQTIAALTLASGGAVGGTMIAGAKSPPPAAVQIDYAPAIATVASTAKTDNDRTRMDVQGELARHKGELAAALDKMATVQNKQADTIKAIGEDLAFIRGQMTARRR